MICKCLLHVTPQNTNRIYHCDPHSTNIFPSTMWGKNANKCCYRRRNCAVKLTVCYVTKWERKDKNRGRAHSAPDQRPLIQLWVGGMYTGLVGTGSLNVSCVRQLFKRKQSHPEREERRIQSGECRIWWDGIKLGGREHAHTHAHTSRHPSPTSLHNSASADMTHTQKASWWTMPLSFGKKYLEIISRAQQSCKMSMLYEAPGAFLSSLQ